ncbi:response regulator [Armatimonas rosea]|uniref:CheY-like chemotaxis protein n=1 Tax=Armatimonas rosea TaxID=685828 RepID=A0A7W9SPW5_ARMRO|nr:CheY-like chemotaxis protein [Armatimonas rosea]
MKTILIAEDEPHVRGLIRVHLDRAGYRVEMAENGQQAWERLQRGGIDLLITDGVMPQLNGLELIEKVQTDPVLYSLPICLISLPLYNHLPHAEQITEALVRFRVAAIVPKPFNPMELLHAVNRIFETS